MTGYAADAAARARILTGRALDTVLTEPKDGETARERAERLEDTAALLDTLPGDKRREGRLFEARNEPDNAIKTYAEADRPKDVAARPPERRPVGRRHEAGRRRDRGRPGVAREARRPRRRAAGRAEPQAAERRTGPPRTAAGQDPEASAAKGGSVPRERVDLHPGRPPRRAPAPGIPGCRRAHEDPRRPTKITAERA